MDTSIFSVTASVWTILRPYFPLIGKHANQKLEETLPVFVDKVWGLVSEKMFENPNSQDELKELLKFSTDEDSEARFRSRLKKAVAKDPDFAQELTTLLNQSYMANVQGNGAIAQGPGAKAVGAGGIMIEGGVSGNIVIGSSTPKTKKSG